MSFQPVPFKKLPALGICVGLGLLLFLRSPTTNFVFDEQEALLGNPFLRGDMPIYRAFSLDFWGRTPTETIGSYRPLPNLIWWLLGFTLDAHTPLYLQLVNVLLHGLLAAALGALVLRLTDDRVAAWTTSLAFATLGLATEAVAGVVGLADVLSGLFAVILLWGVVTPGSRGLILVAGATFLGLLAKETQLAVLPAGLLFGLSFRAGGPWWRRSLALATAELVGVAAYGGLRRQFFPFDASLRLPLDPINNPLTGLDVFERLPTVFDLYGRGVAQLVVPLGLSGDYSFAESAPTGWTLAAGWGAMVWACGLGLGSWLLARSRRDARSRAALWALGGLSLIWVPLVQFPVSNALVLLPTVRADRLWYLPALGFCVGVGVLVSRASRMPARRIVWAATGFFLAFQASQARLHTADFASDLTFWRATVRASPRSAKARLNLGVMLGARGQTEARVALTREAVALAPEWPMGQIYLGDALCRRQRLDEAWSSYRRGLQLGPNQRSLVALALQCLWDHEQFPRRVRELSDLGADHPGSWLAYLVRELELNGEKNGGVLPQYRPRAYNEALGP